MVDDTTLHLRRRVLAIVEKAGCPVTIADMSEIERQRNTAPGRVREAVEFLERRGYLTNLASLESPYFEISETGRAQLEQTARQLDVGLWGRIAL